MTTREATRYPGIAKISKPDGSTVYRWITDAPRKPGQPRKQVSGTCPTEKEARAAQAAVKVRSADRTYVARDKMTVREYLTTWLASQNHIGPACRSSYEQALRLPLAMLGDIRLQSLDESDIIAMVDHMMTPAARVRGKAGQPLSPRAIQLVLGTLRRAFRVAVRQRLMTFNPAEDVRPPAQRKRTAELPWSESEVRAFMTAITDDRMHAVLRLSMLACRPEEVCGLRWGDVNLSAGVISIANVRTMVRGKTVEKDTKTEAGARVLPLDPGTLRALEALRDRQVLEAMEYGEAYHGGEYVASDELGRPYSTIRLRRLFLRLSEAAGLRRITLYQARHSCLSWLANSGQVPISVVAAWAGHSDASVTLQHYVKVQPGDLRQAADALSVLLG